MATTDKKEFTLKQVLTGATGRLVGTTDDMYAIYTFMSGEPNLVTHQIQRLVQPTIQWVQHQITWTRGLDKTFPRFNASTMEGVLQPYYKKYGDSFWLHPIPLDDQSHKDAIQEAGELFGDENVIHIDTDE